MSLNDLLRAGRLRRHSASPGNITDLLRLTDAVLEIPNVSYIPGAAMEEGIAPRQDMGLGPRCAVSATAQRAGGGLYLGAPPPVLRLAPVHQNSGGRVVQGQ